MWGRIRCRSPPCDSHSSVWRSGGLDGSVGPARAGGAGARPAGITGHLSASNRHCPPRGGACRATTSGAAAAGPGRGRRTDNGGGRTRARGHGPPPSDGGAGLCGGVGGRETGASSDCLYTAGRVWADRAGLSAGVGARDATAASVHLDRGPGGVELTRTAAVAESLLAPAAAGPAAGLCGLCGLSAGLLAANCPPLPACTTSDHRPSLSSGPDFTPPTDRHLCLRIGPRSRLLG